MAFGKGPSGQTDREKAEGGEADSAAEHQADVNRDAE